jgi:hypothetical protein
VCGLPGVQHKALVAKPRSLAVFEPFPADKSWPAAAADAAFRFVTL